jgi:hypothetical protein
MARFPNFHHRAFSCKRKISTAREKVGREVRIRIWRIGDGQTGHARLYGRPGAKMKQNHRCTVVHGPESSYLHPKTKAQTLLRMRRRKTCTDSECLPRTYRGICSCATGYTLPLGYSGSPLFATRASGRNGTDRWCGRPTGHARAGWPSVLTELSPVGQVLRCLGSAWILVWCSSDFWKRRRSVWEPYILDAEHIFLWKLSGRGVLVERAACPAILIFILFYAML